MANCSFQANVQTNEDNIEQETQTDEIEEKTKWCQHTSDMQACGGKLICDVKLVFSGFVKCVVQFFAGFVTIPS